MIRRRKTRVVSIGRVKVGGNAPISIQSMAKQKTANAAVVIKEIKRLEKAGCEIMRLAIKDKEDLSALKKIKKAVKIPLVADIHFNYSLALGAIGLGADCIRLNPGNIYKPDEVREIIRSANRAKIPIRIGANSGSLKRFSMVESVKSYLKHFQEANFHDIIISLKSSDVLLTIAAYRKMAALCDYPFHLGITAAGAKEDGIIKSAIGIGALLSEGIGDTIRVSLTSDPVDEVDAAKSILRSLRLRRFGPEIISCPTCGRCQVDIKGVVNKLKERVKGLNKRPATIAVMGCEVNGPGEAKDADIGIAAGKRSGALFKKGKIIKRIKEKDFIKEILGQL